MANDEPWRKPPSGDRQAPSVANDEPWRKPPPVPTPNNEEPQKNSVDGGSKEDSSENKDAKDSTTTSNNNKNSSSTDSDSNKTVITKDSSVELKYNYCEGQWSPANQTGKKSYDRNFLLQMQYSNESLEKPDGLPRLPDVILDKPLPRNDPTRGGMSHLKAGSDIDFTPGFVKPTNAKVSWAFLTFWIEFFLNEETGEYHDAGNDKTHLYRNNCITSGLPNVREK